MTITAPYLFDTDTTPAADGTIELSDRWNIAGGTCNGGYLLAATLQGLRPHLPAPDPLAVSAYYLRPGVAGPAEISAEVIKAGRRVATGAARLRQGGNDVVALTASFTDLDAVPQDAATFADPPELPDPAECVNPIAGGALPGVSIAERIDVAYAQPPGWITGRPSGTPYAQFWMRFADGRPADTVSLPMLVDAAAPVVFELGDMPSSTMQLTVHVRARPEPGWLACRVRTRYVTGGMHEEDFEIFDGTGKLVAQSRQLAMLL